MMSSGVGGVAGMAMLVLVATSLIAVSARPNQGLFLDDMRRPVYRGKQRTRESKSDTTEVIVKSDISVVPDDRVMGRATVATPTLGEAVKMVTKQLLQDPAATDMVATDVRTPPRVKNRLEGEAIPIAEVPDTSTPQSFAKVTTNGGLSTWILLNNGEQSTTAPYKKSTALPQSQAKKAGNSPRPTAVIEKVIKKGNESKVEKLSASIASPLVATKKPDRPTTKQPLFDSKFKSRTPVIVGRLPSQKNKTETSLKKVPTTQIPVTTIDVVTKKKPTGSKHTVFIPEAIPTTSLLLESSTLEAPEVPTTASDSSTTTKRPRRPSTKTKKKKNKIRTRPTKQPSSQDKIDTDVADTKIETFNRPLSTRIYNYLAREVMPNVGVGLVGLVLTAGLAGLLLYPFGGVVTRRNYDKVAPTPDSHTYYSPYDSYSPHAGEISNVNMEDNSYTMPSNQQNSYVAPVYEGQKYNNHYRYEVQDYANENVNGYAGIKDYSTLPDSVKNTQYSTLPESSNYYNMEPMVPLNPQYKDPQYKDPQFKDPQYKDPQYKESQYKDPQYKEPQYKDIDDSINKYENKYPSLTEYTAYTSASAVGTSGTYEKSSNNYENSGMNYEKPIISYENTAGDYDRSDIVYDKSPTYHANSNKNKTSKADTGELEKAESNADKQPHYSALSSKPTFGNSEFVGSVSVSGSYGAELGHMTGMLPSTDLGPRNIKLNRKKRNANDLANEIDSDDKMINDSQKDETTTIFAETTTKGVQLTNDQNPIKSIYNEVNEMSNEIFPTERHDEPTPNATDPDKTTTELPDNLKQNSTKNESEGMTPVPDEEFGFMNILKRLLQLKLKVGINFIKTTSDAFQRYVAGVTQRMETAVLKLNERSYSSSSLNEIHRRRRDTSKRSHSNYHTKLKKN